MAKPNFQGLRVLSLESRRATEISTLISNFGGVPTVAPALREVPRSSNTEALAFGDALLRDEFDAVIFLTGVGTRALASVIDEAHPREAFIAALTRTKIVVRGPKPLAVLREWQVPIWVVAPEPNTWRDLLTAVDAKIDELPAHPRVAVQEYGITNLELLQGLEARGAVVTRVPVYQWALPENIQPLKDAVVALTKDEIDIVLLTTGVQITHLFEVAAGMQLETALQQGINRAVVASIGPTTSEELRRRGLPVDLEASHPKMGVLVTEAAARGPELILGKRRSNLTGSEDEV